LLRIHFLQHWFNLSDSAVSKHRTNRVRCASSPKLIWVTSRCPTNPRSASSPAVCWSSTSRVGASLEVVGTQLQTKGFRPPGHCRGCDLHRNAQLDQERRGRARPADEAVQEGRAVALRHEDPCRRGRQEQADWPGVATPGQYTMARRRTAAR